MFTLTVCDGISTGHLVMPATTAASPSALCPDLLRWEQIGAADSGRGRVVRAFFWLLRSWPPKENTAWRS